MTRHLGNPIPSPAVFAQIGNRFRREVKAFAADNVFLLKWSVRNCCLRLTR